MHLCKKDALKEGDADKPPTDDSSHSNKASEKADPTDGSKTPGKDADSDDEKDDNGIGAITVCTDESSPFLCYFDIFDIFARYWDSSCHRSSFWLF